VPKAVAAMIQLQRLTGMRPGSVVIMRGIDLKVMEKVWEYRPSTHKVEHHDIDLLVFLGPKAMGVADFPGSGCESGYNAVDCGDGSVVAKEWPQGVWPWIGKQFNFLSSSSLNKCVANSSGRCVRSPMP